MTKVLVVDDSEFFRKIYSKELTDAGFEVETAENGKVAIDKMLSSPPQLVFLDFVMPVMTGEQVLNEMKKNDKLHNIPVIMLTSISAEIKGEELLSSGPLAAYLTKDKATGDQIVNKAKEVLGTSEKPFDPLAK
jgi:two-component system alkaline phosphatase synthesis response regulator PhoP